MRDLVTDLLESERLAGGHAALHVEPVDLNLLVQETLAALPGAAHFRLALDPDLPRTSLDPIRMRLLLRNLIENAMRHGAQAEEPPEVRTARDGDHLMLSVRDHGPGVEAAQLPLLAEAFYRPDSARLRATGGVGLGLYLCRLVAQAHGGTLELRNAAPGFEAIARLPLSMD